MKKKESFIRSPLFSSNLSRWVKLTKRPSARKLLPDWKQSRNSHQWEDLWGCLSNLGSVHIDRHKELCSSKFRTIL